MYRKKELQRQGGAKEMEKVATKQELGTMPVISEGKVILNQGYCPYYLRSNN